MPMTDKDIEELKGMLPVARKGPVNFGLIIPGKKGNEALLLHRRMAPDLLQRRAKQLGGAGVMVSGTLTLSGKEITLDVTDKPKGPVCKRLKLFLKEVTGDTYKVLLRTASGDTESDGEDEETAEEIPQAAPEGASDGGGDAALARTAEALLQKLAPQIKAGITANPKAQDPLQKLMRAIREAGAAGDGDTLKLRAKQITDLLGKLAGAAKQAGSDDGGVSLVKLGKARLEWPGVRDKAFADLGLLKKAITADYADMPEAAQQVSGALATLDKSLSVFQLDLHDKLDEVLNAEGAARAGKVVEVRRIIDAFGKRLDSDPILGALDENDILPVQIAAPLRGKLGEISEALGA